MEDLIKLNLINNYINAKNTNSVDNDYQFKKIQLLNSSSSTILSVKVQLFSSNNVELFNFYNNIDDEIYAFPGWDIVIMTPMFITSKNKVKVYWNENSQVNFEYTPSIIVSPTETNTQTYYTSSASLPEIDGIKVPAMLEIVKERTGATGEKGYKNLVTPYGSFFEPHIRFTMPDTKNYPLIIEFI